MNNKHLVGKHISSFELYDANGPITGVSLFLSEETKPIDVGDATGYVLDVFCPFGTKQMANAILSQLKGKTYQGFRAENAILSPTAELGDGLIVNDGYYLLAHRTVNFGPGHMSDISAPGENELEHEYGWESPEKREFNRQFSGIRSEIAKTNEKIDIGIYGEEGSFTKLNLSLGNLSAEVHGTGGEDTGLVGAVAKLNLSLGELTAKVTGTGGLSDQYAALSLKMNELKLSVTNNNGTVSIALNSGENGMGSGTIDLTGMVTFSALGKAPEGTGVTKINGGWIDAESLTVNAGKINGTLDVGKINMKGNITWDFLDGTTQKKITDAAKSGGHTDGEIRTLINKKLVSSPTIAGGVFQDEREYPDAALYLDREYDKRGNLINAGVVLERNIYYYDRYGEKDELKDTLQTLQIWDSGLDTVSFASRGRTFLTMMGGLDITAQGFWVFDDTVHFRGKVDFSDADVTGL